MRNLKKWMSVVLVCSLWMLMFACGTPGEGNNGNNGSNSGNSQSSANGLCGAGCPTGQFCWNGVCAIGCNTNAECASDQYCDTDIKQCANKTIPTCPDTPCKENQTCVNGYCSAKAAPPPKKKDESGACKLAVDGNDGCKSNEICIDAEEEKTQCRAFPRCPQSGQCPTGHTGAVCND